MTRAIVLAVVLLGPSLAEADAPGAALYQRYCASCHGVSGRGDGPVAASLKEAPADLTRTPDPGKGAADVASLMEVIDGRRDVAAHGSREMPVWGTVIGKQLEGKPYPERTTLTQLRELAEYVLTLRAK